MVSCTRRSWLVVSLSLLLACGSGHGGGPPSVTGGNAGQGEGATGGSGESAGTGDFGGTGELAGTGESGGIGGGNGGRGGTGGRGGSGGTGGSSGVGGSLGGTMSGGSGPDLEPCPPNAPDTACDDAGSYCRLDDARTCFCTGRTWFCSEVEPDTGESALTGAYRGDDNRACLSCAESKCTSAESAVAHSAAESLAAVACELATGCPLGPGGVESCYCGSSATSGTDCLYTGVQDGVCGTEERRGINLTTPFGLLSHYFDAQTSTGEANALARCLVDEGCTSCFRAHEQNACPSVFAMALTGNVTAARASAEVGRRIALTAAATDPDAGPSPLSYAWSVDSDAVGRVSDADAAEATFTCTASGYAVITVVISDGDSGCDWSRRELVSCLPPHCESFLPVTADALAAFTGDSLTLAADVRDPNGAAGTFEYAWTASPAETGTLGEDGSETTTYSCTAPGVVTVSAAVTAAADGCSVTRTLSLACIGPAPSDKPTPGSTEDALLGTYRGQQDDSCLACAQANGCVATAGVLPCEYRQTPAERAACLRLLACELESGCPTESSLSLASCLCTRTDSCFTDQGVQDGPCAAELESALASEDENFIANHLTDPALPGGQADVLATCLSYYGCTSCFPVNTCPSVDAIAATPPSAPVGGTVALTASVTDPDGPEPLVYQWIVGHVDAGNLGTIADVSAAQTTFTCEIPGTASMVLIASDGKCSRSGIVDVTCTDH
jgi:hypothetical protein